MDLLYFVFDYVNDPFNKQLALVCVVTYHIADMIINFQK